jgi:hypothetical protein
MVWEHIMIYDKNRGVGVDIDIIDNHVVVDKITYRDFEQP